MIWRIVSFDFWEAQSKTSFGVSWRLYDLLMMFLSALPSSWQKISDSLPVSSSCMYVGFQWKPSMIQKNYYPTVWDPHTNVAFHLFSPFRIITTQKTLKTMARAVSGVTTGDQWSYSVTKVIKVRSWGKGKCFFVSFGIDQITSGLVVSIAIE